MDESFTRWRGSSSVFENEQSIVIDETDEEVDSQKEHVYILEDSEESKSSTRTSTPRRLASSTGRSSLTETAIRNRVKKYIVDSDEESIEDDDSDKNDNDNSENKEDSREYISSRISDLSNSSDSSDNDDDEHKAKVAAANRKAKRKDISHDITKEDIKDPRISTSIDQSFSLTREQIGIKYENNFKKEDLDQKPATAPIYDLTVDDSDTPDTAIALARQELGVGNLDPMVAQKRALLICKLDHLKIQLAKTKLLIESGNLDILPDKGEKLRLSMITQEQEVLEIQMELDNTTLTKNFKPETYSFKEQEQYPEKDNTPTITGVYSPSYFPHNTSMSEANKDLGKIAQATFDRELALTVDRIQDLHGSLVARPLEDERANDPEGLKVKLMPHQQHALAWLIWREEQRPPGGVLADDMGLGKTLTMISLIIASIMKQRSVDSEDEWYSRDKPIRHHGGTLVVCPASLISQWEKEINMRCKKGLLSIELYHGTNRENVPKRLARKDVVITTYNILSREFKSHSMVYKIHWKRVILDEAHVIRNHKSQACEAVCGLLAKARWALTGTPIQNKEMDLYSIIKFLQCSPFDDIRVWKRWVDNKNAAGNQRLSTVMKTLMLRRTKKELQEKGVLESLPDKCIEQIYVKLDPDEQLVYEKVLIFSRTLFAQFLSQRAEKDHLADLGSGKYDKPSFLSNPNKNTQFTKAQNKLLSLHADVKTHEILVLLLRLRQICVHPSLINAMLDQVDMMENGITDTENLDPDLLTKINNISLDGNEIANNSTDETEQEIGVDSRVVANLLTSTNPVFQEKRLSSKMRAVIGTVQEILQKNDKVIIVSQWSSTLDLMATYLSSIPGATYSKFTGQVPIKARQGIMDSFNAVNSDPKILLLSLTAGGVGLNLIGANHLLLMDIHWNPQLETQAQDRIYRFGQKKDVNIYKFICKDTIEERIQMLQERKLSIASSVLSGDKSTANSKLTLNDLKSLFSL